MDNTYQIAQRLFSNDYFKMVLRDQVQLICEQMIKSATAKQSPFGTSNVVSVDEASVQNPENSQIPTKTVIQDIYQSLVEVSRATIMNETNNFYDIINKRNQTTIKDQQQKFSAFIQQKENQINEAIQQIKSLSYKHNKKISLKHSKMLIGKSLINLHDKSLVNSNSLGQVYQPKLNQSDFRSLAESIDQDTLFNANFEFQGQQKSTRQTRQIECSSQKRQSSQIIKKIRQLEQSQRMIKKEMFEAQKQTQQITENDIKRLKQKFVDMKLKMEQRIDEGFCGVWNVVSLLEKKSSKKESNEAGVSAQIAKKTKQRQ